ncbi:MAG: diguanylate cyclase domain-containing protein [Burkholderiales bacterium]
MNWRVGLHWAERSCLVMFVAFVLGVSPNFALADSPSERLVLDDRLQQVELWPYVRTLHDPEGLLSPAQAVAELHRFTVPVSAYATLGLRQKVMWLHVPLRTTAGTDGDWVFDQDYTLINRMDLMLVRDGEIVYRTRLGNLVPRDERAVNARNHVAELQLEANRSYELLIRVETIGSMILPMRLSKLGAFHERGLHEQMLQGAMAAIVFCLVLYSLLQWRSLRETLYLKYSLLILGSGFFSIHFFGIGSLYFWPDNVWLETHLAGITSLVASAGTALFVEEVLGTDLRPWVRRALKTVAYLNLFAALLHGLDVIDIHGVSLVMATIGLCPSLLGLPGAWARIHRGDTVGWYFMFAWVLYFLVSAIMVGVVKGYIPANVWTMHAFQFGATVDMLIFLRIAVLRTAAMHAAAQRAARERDTLHSLAHTDALTGLLNRRGLNDALAASATTVSVERMMAVYMMDLDGFKPVNDQYGHDVGDELLVAVSHRLRNTVRAGDVVARLGGDEFVVVAIGLTYENQAREVGQKLLEVFASPFQLRQFTVRVGCTIGFAIAPYDGIDPVNLLKAADAGMYAGKDAGANRLTRGLATAGI